MVNVVVFPSVYLLVFQSYIVFIHVWSTLAGGFIIKRMNGII